MAFVYTYGASTGYTGTATSGWQPQTYAYGGKITFAEAGTIDQLGGYFSNQTGGSGPTVKYALYDTSGNLIVDGGSSVVSSSTMTWVDSPTFTATAVSAAAYVILTSASAADTHQGYHPSNNGTYAQDGATAPYAGFPASSYTLALDAESGLGYGRRANFTAGVGGTQYNQSAGGGFTPAGTQSKQSGKVVSGSAAPSGVDSRHTTKSFSGVFNPAGAETKFTQKSFAGSFAPDGIIDTTLLFTRALEGAMAASGAISRGVGKLVSGTVNPAASLIRSVTKSFAGSMAVSGSINRDTSKPITGSVSPSAILDTVVALFRLATGTLTPSGSQSKLTLKSPSGELGSTSTQTKRTSKGLSGAAIFGGSPSKETSISQSGSVTPTGGAESGVSFQQAVAGVLAPFAAIGSTIVQIILSLIDIGPVYDVTSKPTKPTTRDSIR